MAIKTTRYRVSCGITLAVLVIASSACSHSLAVRNLDQYAAPIQLTRIESQPRIGILPFAGTPDDLFYFNAIVEALSQTPGLREVQTDYIARRGSSGRFRPDLILSISPHCEYRSSGWNFLINWPGFLIFTPAWNGYVYHADIMTQIAIHDAEGTLISRADIPVSYGIRQAEMDRTIWTGLTWFEVSALALIGGVYNAFTFDRDLIGQLQPYIKGSYTTFVGNQLKPKLRAAASAIPYRTPPVGSGPPPRDRERGASPPGSTSAPEE